MKFWPFSLPSPFTFVCIILLNIKVSLLSDLDPALSDAAGEGSLHLRRAHEPHPLRVGRAGPGAAAPVTALFSLKLSTATMFSTKVPMLPRSAHSGQMKRKAAVVYGPQGRTRARRSRFSVPFAPNLDPEVIAVTLAFRQTTEAKQSHEPTLSPKSAALGSDKEW